MKVEARIFELTAVFCIVVAVVYLFWAGEPVGVTALFLTGLLSLMIGVYFRFIARRLDERPEDNPDGEISDGAGELGFFSPGSYWPLGLAGACALTGVGLAMFHMYLIVAGTVAVLLTVGGLLFEYHRGPEHE
ncbi:cytochrome c oxidase subunit 4 [Actinoalloteichus sp. AHMU CJ021]|uniref:Cytochrome c oxidase polypeptide 4 n=1 Tax=Actinoalloteichus caeruleus DSM 43889 TaxID=1120930 RepID=A0ABT1JHW4_ACTCY|nr:cytochrome c oxidase subunit 4 [Actinoalloteichus caeruleus]AUS77928.1 cytochrome c oxidase subunit 4 [Actinoalloteichus sp. AHMU CJ021]MCP2331894.1 Cytochrome c oxidase subunit IV [Actinoalloteichus caeruleus DSM 43889]